MKAERLQALLNKIKKTPLPVQAESNVFAKGMNPGKVVNGADEGIRTPDLRITNALLYQLSYISKSLSVRCLLVRLVSGDFYRIRIFANNVKRLSNG